MSNSETFCSRKSRDANVDLDATIAGLIARPQHYFESILASR